MEVKDDITQSAKQALLYIHLIVDMALEVQFILMEEFDSSRIMTADEIQQLNI